MQQKATGIYTKKVEFMFANFMQIYFWRKNEMIFFEENKFIA